MKPTVSFLIPCYNSESFINRTYNCLTMQDYENLEFIFINDGSIDSTLTLLKKFQERDSRVTIVNKLNGGLESALKTGIEHITGKYTFLHGHDDWISENLTSECLKTFDKFPDADAVNPGLLAVDENGKELFSFENSERLTGREALLKTIDVWEIHTFNLWKTNIFKKITEINSGGLMNFDELATRYLLCRCKAIYPAKATYFYLNHTEQVTKKMSPKLLHPAKMKVLVKQLLIREGLYDNFKKKYDVMLFQGLKVFVHLYTQLEQKKLLDADSKDILKFAYEGIDKKLLLKKEKGLERLKLYFLLMDFRIYFNHFHRFYKRLEKKKANSKV